MTADRTEFLGLGFDQLTMADTVAWLKARNAASPFAYLVTPNVDHMVRLAKATPEVVAAYEAAPLVLCDSRVLARLAATMGVALTVVPGSDLAWHLFDEVLAPGDRICLIGGSVDDAARLASLYPQIDIRHHDAARGLRHDPTARSAAVRFAADAGARVTLVAVGSPQQELIAHEMALAGDVGGTALCIGAAVDFITGTQRRAPMIVQRASLEWAWRLLRDPRRLARRYLIEGPAIFGLAWRWNRGRGRP